MTARFDFIGPVVDDMAWGQRYATVRDPDGNGVDLFARLPTPN